MKDEYLVKFYRYGDAPIGVYTSFASTRTIVRDNMLYTLDKTRLDNFVPTNDGGIKKSNIERFEIEKVEK